MKNCLTSKDYSHLQNIDSTSIEACKKFIDLIIGRSDESFRLLDIGCGQKRHTKLFEKCEIDTYTIDMDSVNNPTFVEDYNRFKVPFLFDGIWCNHVLEHQINVNDFLVKLRQDIVPKGLVCINVPKAYYRENPHKIVSGHVTMWNAGLLLYNMILAGFDCSKAKVLTKRYNVTVLVERVDIEKVPQLTMNRGDIERLNKFFPFKATQGFDGDIKEINWL